MPRRAIRARSPAVRSRVSVAAPIRAWPHLLWPPHHQRHVQQLVVKGVAVKDPIVVEQFLSVVRRHDQEKVVAVTTVQFLNQAAQRVVVVRNPGGVPLTNPPFVLRRDLQPAVANIGKGLRATVDRRTIRLDEFRRKGLRWRVRVVGIESMEVNKGPLVAPRSSSQSNAALWTLPALSLMVGSVPLIESLVESLEYNIVEPPGEAERRRQVRVGRNRNRAVAGAGKVLGEGRRPCFGNGPAAQEAVAGEQ